MTTTTTTATLTMTPSTSSSSSKSDNNQQQETSLVGTSYHSPSSYGTKSQKKKKKQARAERKLRKANYHRFQQFKRAKQELYERAFSGASHDIYHLSEDIWVQVMSYLPTANMLRMKFVCRLFHYLLTDHTHGFIDEATLVAYGWKHVEQQERCRKRSLNKKFNSHLSIAIPNEQVELYHSALYRKIDFGSSFLRDVRRTIDAEVFVEHNWYFHDEMIAGSSLTTSPIVSGEYDDRGGTFDACLSEQAHSVVTFELLVNLIVAHGKHIEELVLNDCDAVNDSIVRIIFEYCPRLKRLELNSCMNITEFSRQTILNCSESQKRNLQICEFQYCPLMELNEEDQNKFNDIVVQHFKGFGNSKQFTWKSINNFDDILVPFMERADKELNADLLQRLRERRGTVSDRSANFMEVKELTMMRHFDPLPNHHDRLYRLYETVESIDLSFMNSVNMGLGFLPVLTQKFRNLRSISMNTGGSDQMFNVDERTQKKCWEAAKTNTKLKHLRLSGEFFSMGPDDRSIELQDMLSCYPALETIDLYTCMERDDLCALLRTHPNLKSLKINDIRVSEFEGANELIGSNLESLSLSIDTSTYQTSPEAQHFYPFLRTVCPQLKRLEITMKNASDKQIAIEFGDTVTEIIGQYGSKLESLTLGSLQFTIPNPFIWKIKSTVRDLTLNTVTCVRRYTVEQYEDDQGECALRALRIHSSSSSLLELLPASMPHLRQISFVKNSATTQQQFDALISFENAPYIHSIHIDAPNVDGLSKLVECTKESPSIRLRHVNCTHTISPNVIHVIQKARFGLQTLILDEGHLKEDPTQIGVELVKHCRHLRYFDCLAHMDSKQIAESFETRPLRQMWNIRMSVPADNAYLITDFYNCVSHPVRVVDVHTK